MAQVAWKAREHGRHVLDVPDGADIAGCTMEALLGAGVCGAVYRARRGEERFAHKLLPLKKLVGWAVRKVTILLRLEPQRGGLPRLRHLARPLAALVLNCHVRGREPVPVPWTPKMC